MTLHAGRAGYAGPFDPDFGLADLSRQALCDLGREYLLAGHLQDRVGLPLVIRELGEDAYVGLAIDEWMAASPIYSRRMQRALDFEGDDVGTVFKNLQLDIGAPPQFMDFQFRLDGPERGEFWLPHCGALLDVEPFGEKRVKRMCHDIEDPTFDATAAATNPRLRMRPIHRPPRSPADRVPHCRWQVFLDADAAPAPPNPLLARVAESRIAGIPIALDGDDAEPGGWPDYAGPFDPGFQLEDLSHRALRAVCQEAAVQIHLLARAFLLAVAGRAGEDGAGEAVAREIGRRQWTGIAALAAQRLKSALSVEGEGIDAVGKLFQLHPHFQPRTYVDLRVEVRSADTARLSIGDCPALAEGDDHSWLAGLGAGPHPALEAIARAGSPRARLRAVPAPAPARLAWEVVLDAGAPPQPEPPELALARLSRGAGFAFERRRPLRP